MGAEAASPEREGEVVSVSAIEVQQRLVEVEEQLAEMQNRLLDQSLAAGRAERDAAVTKETAYAAASGPATERKVVADAAAAQVGVDERATFTATKLLVHVLEARANIGMALLKSFGRS